MAAAAFGVLTGADVQWAEIAGVELVGVSYIVAGTIAWLRRPGNPIGPAILLTGITSYIPAFVHVAIPAVTSATFAFAFVTNLFAAFILLAYPSGRFFSRAARLVFWVAVLGTVIPVIARLFLLDSGSDFSSATGPSALSYGCDCLNPFVLLPDDRLYGGAMLVSRLVTVLVTATVLILIVQRWFRASAASRRQLVPVMFAGAVGLAAFAIDEITFTASGGEQPILAVTTSGWCWRERPCRSDSCSAFFGPRSIVHWWAGWSSSLAARRLPSGSRPWWRQRSTTPASGSATGPPPLRHISTPPAIASNRSHPPRGPSRRSTATANHCVSSSTTPPCRTKPT